MTDVQPKTLTAKNMWIGSLEFDDPDLWDAFLAYGQFVDVGNTSGEGAQTSSGAPSSQPAVVANGAPKDGLTAAFNPADHPRGKDGKFIKKGVGLPNFVFDALALLKKHDSLSELTSSEKDDFIGDIPSITSKQWHNLKTEDKKRILDAADEALEEGVPGSATAVTHLEDLDVGGDQDETPNVFSPDTELPKPAPAPAPAPAPVAPTITVAKATPIKVTHGLIHAKHTPGEVIAQTKTPIGTVRVRWTGSDYAVEFWKNGAIVVSSKHKKSQLYAHLAKNFPNATWVKTGKQNVEVNAPSASAPSVTAPTLNAPATKPTFPSGTQVVDASQAWHNTDFLGDSSFHESGKYKIAIGPGDTVTLYKKNAKGEWETKGKQVDEGQIPLGDWGDMEPVATPVNPPKVPTKVAVVPTPLGDAPGPSAAKVSKGAGLNMTGWKQVGGQGGSNKGALFEAPDGTRYYVKSLQTDEHANNEVLAASLYQLVGVEVPEIRHVTSGAPSGWSNVIASKIVPNATQKHNKFDGKDNVKFKQDTQDGFLVDVWLANHDVIGAVEDNIVVVNGKPVRIDVGGSMLFRAMGSKKGADWGPDPFKNSNSSYFGMKSKTKNFKAFKVFGDMTPEQERESAKHLLGITDEQIDQQVKDAGLPDSIAKTLRQRRDNILKYFNLEKDGSVTPNSPAGDTDASDVPASPLGVSKPEPKPILTKEDWLKQWNKGLLTTAEYKLLTGEDPPTQSTTTHASISSLMKVVSPDVNADKYKPGDVIAIGSSAKHPNAEYRLIVDEDGVPTFQYKTPNFDWKENSTPQTFDKVNVEWTVNPPSDDESKKSNIEWHTVVFNATNGELLAHAPGGFQAIYDGPNDTVQVFENGKYLQTLSADDVENGALEGAFPSLNWSMGAVSPSSNPVTAPTTPAAAVSVVPHLSEDIISNWPGVASKSYVPGEIVAHSVDGKWTLKKSDTGSDFFHVVDGAGDLFASFSPADVKKGYVQDVTSGGDWFIPSKASGASSLNAPSPTGSAPSVGIGHLNAGDKAWFYKHFKDEKVSPAWSGAKIYNSLQVAKMKMAGNVSIAALTDDQMLDIVDEQLKINHPGKYAAGDKPFKTKVVDWLKTPNGKKAALAAKSGGWASGHAAVSTSTGPSAPSVVGPAAKKVAKKVAASQKLTVTQALDDGGASPDITTMSDSDKLAIFQAFKAGAHGKFFKDSPADIYHNANSLGKSHGLTPGTVLKIVDEQTAKKLGFFNNHQYEDKIKTWVGTPTGSKTSYEVKHGTYVPGTTTSTGAKKASSVGKKASGTVFGSSFSGSTAFAANTPFSQKVQLKGDQIEPFDTSKGAGDFPIVSTSQAKTIWSNMEAVEGSITPGQKSSLKFYTSNAGFTAMNGYLRGKKGATQATQDHIRKAQDGMRRLTQDVTLHRGAGYFTGWGSYAEIKAREGTVWHEPAFFSASVSGKSAFGGAIAYIIEVPAGTPAAYVKAFSNYGSENEFFLGAGLKYQIISVEGKGSPTTSGSQVTVRLRVVPDSTPSLNVVASGKKA